MTAEITIEEEAVVATEPAVTTAAGPSTDTSFLLSGTSALGAGFAAERGLGFLANLMAARIGGAETFGAYSLAIAAANNISTYAAGGIGSTATRFSGKYPRGSQEYPTLARVLVIVSCASALIAAGILWLGAAPLAGFLHKSSLTGLLRWAAFSAAGIILLECCRGFMVGQRRLLGIVTLSLCVGVGMISLTPMVAKLGPVAMICSQGLVTTCAVLLCIGLYRPLGLASPLTSRSRPATGPMLREVWSFTLIQLAGLVGMNAAGWWLTSLVARSDTSMVQMGFYAIGNQLRNMVALAPGLLSQSGLAVMADSQAANDQRPDRVMAICSFISALVALVFAGIGILLTPWALRLVYGTPFAGATAATILSLATAVVHMGSSPSAARLSILSIQRNGLINTVWAIVVAGSACLFLFQRGDASLGAAIILVAHVLSAGLVLLALKSKSAVPDGFTQLFVISTAATLAMAGLGVARERMPDSYWTCTALLFAVFAISLVSLTALGRRQHWIPNASTLLSTVARMLPKRWSRA